MHSWFAALGISAVLCASVPSWAAEEHAADHILIVKSTRTLTLLNHGQVLKTYNVALGGDPVGPKLKAGDKKTPEGEYIIDSKNPHSRFHLALHISYPNPADSERARKLGVSPGGGVEIHGLEAKYAWVGSLHRQINWTAGCSGQSNEHSHTRVRQLEYHDLPFRNELEARADSGGEDEPNHKAVHIRQRKNNMQMTSRWIRCVATTIFVLFVAQSVLEAVSARPRLVEVWCGGDDGLTLRLKDTLENAFKSSSAFALSSGKKPGTLIVTIPTHVEWKQVGKRTQVLYTVEFATVDNQPLGTSKGSCWDDALTQCTSRIVKNAKVAAGKIHQD